MRWHATIWLLSLGVALGPGAVAAQTFIRLPAEVSAEGLSDDGLVVVGGRRAISGEAVRWTAAGGVLRLGFLPGLGDRSRAIAVSADGGVVVGWSCLLDISQSCGISGAFRWTEAGGMLELTGGTAEGVSADGSVVVGISGGALSGEAYRWTAVGGVDELGVLAGGAWSRARGVSADGAVVVGRADGERAFRWTAADGLLDPGFGDGADAISADGATIVGSHFRWTEAGGARDLGVLPGDVESRALGVSGDGAVVVGWSGDDLALREAFIWDRPNGMQPLASVLETAGAALAGWTLEEARGVSADGRRIVGEGTNPAGPTAQSWLATLDCPGDDDCDSVLDGEDNCPGLRTANIADADGNGIGDACECGDQTGDGFVTIEDVLAINDVIFEAQQASPLCDTNDDDACNVADILGVNARIFGAEAFCSRHPAP